jgi:M6 family metalloprotease-like protein
MSVGHRTFLTAATGLVAFLSVKVANAGVARPPPGVYSQADWDSLRDWRRAANFTHDYRPRHISQWQCSMGTEELCQFEDEAMGKLRQSNQRSRRRLYSTQRRAVRESPSPESESSVPAQEAPGHRRLNPSKGNVRILVLLARFKGDEQKELPPREYFEEMFNGQGTSDINLAGSVHEYLRLASIDQYSAEFVVQDWVQLSVTEEQAARGQAGRIPPEELLPTFAEAIVAADNALNLNDWLTFDVGSYLSQESSSEPDFILDHLVIIHSGWGAEFGDGPSDCSANIQQNRIWSQGTAGNFFDVRVENRAFTVGGFAVGAALRGVCDFTPIEMGIITHEMMHGFGLIDLYDTDLDEADYSIGGVGNFDLMANMHGWNSDAHFPGTLGPVSRMDVGWLDPIEITQDGVYAIQPAEVSAMIYIIRSGFPVGEYLLIESRQPIKFDQDRPPGGLVIWHVDLKVDRQTTRGYPGHPRFPAEHYMVSVLQQDGKYDIEKGEDQGDGEDFFRQGMILSPSADQWPNTASYQSGVKETGISIEVLADSGLITTFRVTGVTGKPAATGPYLSPMDVVGKNFNFDVKGWDSDSGGDLGTMESFDEGPSTGNTMAWVLSILGGIGTMVGLLAVLM